MEERLRNIHQGYVALGAIRISPSIQVVASVKAVAVVGLHAATVLDSVIVDPGSHNSGTPFQVY